MREASEMHPTLNHIFMLIQPLTYLQLEEQ